ncbi:hypothetical protein HZS_3195 [Henneguya salminicola]|nr:hypothetical protein HZS_3195 [Henneguya salminicola]
MEMHLKRMQKPYFCHIQTTRILQIPKKQHKKNDRGFKIYSIILYSCSRHIISETTRILSPNISAIFPEYNTLQRNIQKIRKRANMPYPFPISAFDLIIPDEFKSTFRGKTIHGCGYFARIRRKNYYIFASRRNLNYLSQSSSIYFDDTFKTVTKIF